MDDLDAYPMRDTGYNAFNLSNKNNADCDAAMIKRTTAQKQQITKLVREELEDKYLRLYEENLLLKKHARRQEDKIKRMATKLLRLVSDKKKTDLANAAGKKGSRNVETEEMLEELHGKVRSLEIKNHQLKEKLMVTKAQLATTSLSKGNAYGYVQSRIHTGIPKTPTEPRLNKQLRVSGPLPGGRRNQHSQSYQRAGGHSALDQTTQENRRLEQQIDSLNEQINIYMQEGEMLREQMNVREAEFEEDLLKVKQQMTAGQRTTIQENIDIIKLQREVKEKSTKLTQLQSLYMNLEEKLRTVRNSHDSLLLEMEGLNEQLKKEQHRVLTLQNQLKAGSTSQRATVEFKERCADMERECEILREANEKLVASAFDLEREREWKQRENALKVQIAQLEATLKADVGEKGSILDVLTNEREDKDKLEDEIKDMRQKYFKVKQENDELRDKMKFFSNENVEDFQELEEALVIVKKKKEKKNQELDFLLKVDDEKNSDAKHLVQELRAEHADTCNELEKTRNLLIMQHKINKDYQQEVEAVTQKMEEMRKEYDTKLDEYAALLDIRANRIKKLESQLRDVAYGTRQYRIQSMETDDVASDAEECEDETIILQRGENLFEIHIAKVQLSPESLREMGDEEPQIFGTWEFYEHEVQSTPVTMGPRAEFGFTSQYIVKVDDFFLHYLQKDSCTFELHQSFGTEYRTVAACQIKLKDILDKPEGRLHGTAQLTGTLDGHAGTSYGLLEYWVRLKVPMEQALRLFKERTKALGYISTNLQSAQQALEALDDDAAKRPPDNINQVTIKLLRARDINPRREGIQPSPYVVYRFFDFADHVTVTIPGSNNPDFYDVHVFNVPMSAEFDTYLKTQSLSLYLFDDTDPDDTFYLGHAKIPLIYLAHDKPIKGNFELFMADGSSNGTIDVSIKWKFNYIPPKVGTRTAAQMKQGGEDSVEQMPLLPGEEDALKESVRAGSSGKMSIKGSKDKLSRSHSGPRAVSTPSKTEDRKSSKQLSNIEQQLEKQIIPTKEDPQPELSTQQVSTAASHGTASSHSAASSHGTTSTHGTASSHGSSKSKDKLNMPGPSQSMHERTLSQASVVSEGTPVPGEDESISEVSMEEDDESTPRQAEPQSVQQMQQKSAEELVSEELVSEGLVSEGLVSEGLVSEELEETERSGQMSDTMFGDPKEHDSAEEERDSARSQVTSETDSDVIYASPSSKMGSQLISEPPGDHVIISINHLTLNAEAEVNFKNDVTKLFVEYRFLGVPSEETECPFALPKPKPGHPISFNFTKIFHVDFDNNYERRQFLASMLLPDDPDGGKIKFSVVSEPDDEEGECEDVGTVFVSVRDIADKNSDLNEVEVDIVDVVDERTVIGQLNVTVKCLDALKAVQMEMTGVDSSELA